MRLIQYRSEEQQAKPAYAYAGDYEASELAQLISTGLEVIEEGRELLKR